MKPAVAIARTLLDVGVATFRPDEPFRGVSGKLLPVYLDHRLLLSQPKARERITDELIKLIKANYPGIDCVVGTATSGIPWAAWVAAALDLPMVYVRKDTKEHGQQNRVEGTLAKGSSVVVLEDAIFTGGSAIAAAAVVREAGATPLAIVGIFTYATKIAAEGFREASLPLHTLTNFKVLIDEAHGQGALDSATVSQLEEWVKDPEGWNQRVGAA